MDRIWRGAEEEGGDLLATGDITCAKGLETKRLKMQNEASEREVGKG